MVRGGSRWWLLLLEGCFYTDHVAVARDNVLETVASICFTAQAETSREQFDMTNPNFRIMIS